MLNIRQKHISTSHSLPYSKANCSCSITTYYTFHLHSSVLSHSPASTSQLQVVWSASNGLPVSNSPYLVIQTERFINIKFQNYPSLVMLNVFFQNFQRILLVFYSLSVCCFWGDSKHWYRVLRLEFSKSLKIVFSKNLYSLYQ